MNKTFNVLNLGAGVQSSALLLMSCKGILPKLDAAIFADTGWEPKAVYDQMDFLKAEAKKAGIPVYVVSAGNIREDALDFDARWPSMPVKVKKDDGKQGLLWRQCTQEYKIRPIIKCIKQQVLGMKPYQRIAKNIRVIQWFGITFDEIHRIKGTKDAWRIHAYPFVNIEGDFLDKSWTRQDCVEWLAENYPGRTIVKSACIGCPFRSNDSWGEMKACNPAEFKDAVDFDHGIRGRGNVGDYYLHRTMQPLDQVDLPKTGIVDGNFFDAECEGLCGL